MGSPGISYFLFNKLRSSLLAGGLGFLAHGGFGESSGGPGTALYSIPSFWYCLRHESVFMERIYRNRWNTLFAVRGSQGLSV